MNFREGMRRIGLTVGVIGALAAAFAAFALFFANLADQRNVQAEFNSLLKQGSTVRTDSSSAQTQNQTGGGLGGAGGMGATMTDDIQVHLDDGTTLHFPADIGQDDMHSAVTKFVNQRQIAKNKIVGADAQMQVPLFSDFVRQRQIEIQGHPHGIKQFWADEKGEIASFRMDDGRTIMRTTGPTSLFWYLLYPPIMAAGFVVPWGAVRLVTWIVSGFLRSGGPAPQKA